MRGLITIFPILTQNLKIKRICSSSEICNMNKILCNIMRSQNGGSKVFAVYLIFTNKLILISNTCLEVLYIKDYS